MEFRTLAEIGAHMTFLLRRRDDVEDPRYRGGQLSWLLGENGWMTPVWTHLTFYSSMKDIVRFTNKISTQLPKTQWPHREPNQFRFEMTALIEELEPDLLDEVIDYCNLARRQPKAGFDRHPPRFPKGSDHGGYGWTERAWELQNKRTRG
ncbi:hypothetical protein ACFSSA_08855 [Luteolibacter algae]|uniref:Uncharacterized protein n=1 Tax=Luteolibacter algae TaxID=454151 RepID=A0ABW5D7B7_9BACT